MKYIKIAIIILCLQPFIASSVNAQCTYNITFSDAKIEVTNTSAYRCNNFIFNLCNTTIKYDSISLYISGNGQTFVDQYLDIDNFANHSAFKDTFNLNYNANCLWGAGFGVPSGTYTSVGAGDYTVLTTDVTIGKTSISSGGDTVTLPSSAQVGQQFTIKDVSGTSATDNITIATAGAELIDGLSTYVISSNYQSITVIYDGSNYSII